MTFTDIIKMAQQDARSQYGAEQCDPVQDMTQAIKAMNGDAKPFWLYDEKKKDRTDSSWGPPSPLGSGDTAERAGGPFAAGMNAVFGGV